MFKPTSAKDRINYGEVLMPPTGFRLERAVGTTYSLDFETLTAISISLGLIEDTDSELIANPISMLNALQKISDKITVFCEAGQIKKPTKSNALCLMLEKMIVPVTLPYNQKIKRFPSFHPKTWLMEYSNRDGDKKYRFVVMSRNMTFDHSWDIACSLEGHTTAYENANSKPIIDFISFLRGKLNRNLIDYKRQNRDLSYFIREVASVQFEADSSIFSEFQFLPMGIGAAGYNMPADPLLRENFHDLVVISPFLSGSVIGQLNHYSKSLTGTTRTLITRKSELPKISGVQASNFDVYVMKDEVVDGESAISESEKRDNGAVSEAVQQDIHAKLYLRRKNNVVDLYMGSMNASYAAINSNVEMMIRLRTRSSVLNGKRLLDEIMGEDRESKKNPFERVIPEKVTTQDEITVRDEAEKLIKSICRRKMFAEITETQEGHYDVTITVGIDRSIEGVTIKPLSSNKESAFMPRIVFQSLGLLQLSEFYLIKVQIKDYILERVIMIPTSGIPEERDAEIVRSIIKDKKTFIEYIAFILGDDYVQSFLENRALSSYAGEWAVGNAMPAVYEKMLKASLSDPDRIGEIKYVTQIIEDREIIPDEFREMYQVFCETLGLM